MTSISGFGSEFLVSAAAQDALQPVIVSRSGGFATFWSSPVDAARSSSIDIYAQSDIRGQLFDAAGSPVGVEFTVNSSTAGAQYRPTAVRLSDGNLLVAWQDSVAGFSSRPNLPPVTLRARKFTAGGDPVGDEFLLVSPGDTLLPQLTATTDGGFLATWLDRTGVVSTLQRFDADSQAVGAAITAGQSPNVVFLANGDFVIASVSTSYQAIVQRYDETGTALGSVLELPQTQPVYAANLIPLSTGGFAITLTRDNDTYIEFLSSDGVSLTSSTTQIFALSYDTVATDDGGFVILRSGLDLDGAGDIFAQLIGPDGRPAGEEQLINVRVENGQQSPSIARLDNGDLVAAWADLGEFGTGQARIRGRIIDVEIPNRSPVATDDRVFLRDGQTDIAASALTSNDFDADSDRLSIVSVQSISGGSTSLANETIIFTPDQTGIGRFRYTVQDSAGDTATAEVAVIYPDDRVTLRGGGPFIVDVIANDGLAGDLGRYSIYRPAGGAEVAVVNGYQQLSVSPIENVATSDYFSLLVGQTRTAIVEYSALSSQPGVEGTSARLTITYEGWAQLGGTGADSLTGSELADHLSGGSGAGNWLVGLGGDDWYTVQLADDVVIEAPGGGRDSIRTTLASYTLPDEFENLYLVGGTGAIGTGTAADNIISGTSGNDTLFGLDGNDSISTFAGVDMVYGGRGDDVFTTLQGSLIFENLEEGTDTVVATHNYYLYANIENLTLFEFSSGFGTDIFGVGNELSNRITGNSGANLLIGLDGNDTVSGGSGNDALFGLAGFDVLNGDAGIDYLAAGDGSDTLDGGAHADALYGEDGDDSLVGGASFDTDILVGGTGRDTLNGASGLGDYDLMDGGSGDDLYFVDTPADLTFEAADGGTDRVVADIVGGGYYLYPHVENLLLRGVTPFGVGNDLANFLGAEEGTQWLLGGAGDDSLDGGAGNDVLFGESGADVFVFVGASGADVIGDFTPGTDRIRLIGVPILDFAQLRNGFVENDGTTAINLGDGNFIVLNGVANAALTAGDFVFG